MYLSDKRKNIEEINSQLSLAEIAQQKEIREAFERYLDLIRKHDHKIVKSSLSGICGICGKDQGWWCASIHGVCEYDDSEDCKHCGEPSERK